MTQSTGFEAGQGSSRGMNQSSTSGGGSFGGSTGTMSQGSSAGSFDNRESSDHDWMPQGFGGGQSGDMMESIRDFSRNNRAATIGGGILAILGLAAYASSSGKRRQEQRYRGSWSSGRSRYGDDNRFGREDYRGGRDYSRDSFGSGNRYTGASYSGGSSYGGLRRAGRYGMKHPMSLTAGAALGAMALSWLARGRGQGSSNGWSQRGSSGDWQGSQGSFGSQDFQGSQSGMADSGSFSGSSSSGSFGQGSSGTQSFGRGSMGNDAIEASGSSNDVGQGTAGSSFHRGRTGSGSTGI